MKRRLPNILVTGTPGTGKSTLCSEVSEACPSLQWINVGEVAKEEGMLLEYDTELQTHVLDEDKLVCELEERVRGGGCVVDYHGCDLFPEDWFDIVFVLTTDNTLLYDRLHRRGYSGKKLENNVQCEIFQTLLEEARGAYDPKIVHPLPSDTPDDMTRNTEQLVAWVHLYCSQTHSPTD